MQNGSKLLKEVLKKQSRKGLLSNLFYCIAIAGAFVHSGISAFFIIVVAIMWFIPDRNIEVVMGK